MFYWEDYLPVYMFITLAVLLFTGFPVAFILGGLALAFGMIGWFVGLFSPIEFFNIIPRIWGGSADNLVLVAVPCFVFMGTMLERAGIANSLLHILQVLMRRIPGSMALGVTFMGTILAATTGIIAASVTMMAVLALPPMLRQGYNTELATGTIAASSCLGILIPPSIMLVIMADLLGISVGILFAAAVFPGLILSGLYTTYIVVVTSWRPHLAPALTLEQMPASQRQTWELVFKGFLPPIFLIFLVLGSILGGVATPTEAGAVGAAGAIILAIVNRNLSGAILRDVVDRTSLIIGMVFFILIAASSFSYVFRSLGGDEIIVNAINATGLDSWGVLVLLMATVFILGFFFDWIEISLIVLPVFAPVVEQFDFGTHIAGREVIYWFSILIAVNLQTSFLTPPFGFALFFIKGVAPPSVTMRHIYRGIVPFVALQLIGLSLVLAFPQIAMWLPNQVFD
ncbi:MAG: TRAP transporter large permease subunit [Alphaproteobacteria bacterium]|nr:TRAP transporter large permease subunit [Alphaproteobacteria bacterium]